MNPLYWHKKRHQLAMPLQAELVMDLMNVDKPLPIMTVVYKAELEGVGSISTVHNCLKWLRDYGFVKTLIHDDNRIKQCVLTDKAKRYLRIEHEH
jgi:hypothetical protein